MKVMGLNPGCLLFTLRSKISVEIFWTLKVEQMEDHVLVVLESAVYVRPNSQFLLLMFYPLDT